MSAPLFTLTAHTFTQLYKHIGAISADDLQKVIRLSEVTQPIARTRIYGDGDAILDWAVHSLFVLSVPEKVALLYGIDTNYTLEPDAQGIVATIGGV